MRAIILFSLHFEAIPVGMDPRRHGLGVSRIGQGIETQIAEITAI